MRGRGLQEHVRVWQRGLLAAGEGTGREWGFMGEA